MADAEEFNSSYIAICVFNAFLSYTAIMLNSVTIHAVRKASSLPKTLKTLLLSLSVSDLGVGLLVQPVFIAVVVMKCIKNIDDSIYKATNFAFLIPLTLFAWVSFFTITALSVDRFMTIHLHLRYHELVTRKRVVAAVSSIWVISASILAVRLRAQSRNIVDMVFFIIDVTCYIASSFLNYKTYLAIRQHRQRIKGLRVHQDAQNDHLASIGRQRHSSVATVYVHFVFLACYLPYTCYSFWSFITSGSKSVNELIEDYTLTLVFLNSSLNPLIYCWKMRHVRHNVVELLRNTFGYRKKKWPLATEILYQGCRSIAFLRNSLQDRQHIMEERSQYLQTCEPHELVERSGGQNDYKIHAS